MRRAMRRPNSCQSSNVRAARLAVSEHVYWRARLYVLVLSILSIYLSIYPSVHLSVHLSVHPFIYLSIQSSIYHGPAPARPEDRTRTPHRPSDYPHLRLAGFIPVLYTFAFTRWKKSRSRQHAPEGEEDGLLAENATTTTKPRGKSLRGAHILLMWLPALCDLSGTTVRLPLPYLHLSYFHLPYLRLPRLLLPFLLPFLPATSVPYAPSSPSYTAPNKSSIPPNPKLKSTNQRTKGRILTLSFSFPALLSPPAIHMPRPRSCPRPTLMPTPHAPRQPTCT